VTVTDPIFNDADGILNAQAKVDNPSTAHPLIVDFTWENPAAPGAQSFELFDGNFQVIGFGETIPAVVEPVPEPSSLALVLSALGLMLLVGRRSP
jgi:hypothetical protein